MVPSALETRVKNAILHRLDAILAEAPTNYRFSIGTKFVVDARVVDAELVNRDKAVRFAIWYYLKDAKTGLTLKPGRVYHTQSIESGE